MELPVVRTEFGYKRTQCGCARCTMFCRFMPGYLIPSDLERLIPPGEDPLAWAKVHLRAIMPATPAGMSNLVPAQNANGHCHWLVDGKCTVWQDSPYGCAFFDQHMSVAEHEQRNQRGREARQEAFAQGTLYARLWHALKEAGLVRLGRNKDMNERMAAELFQLERQARADAAERAPAVVELFAYTCPHSRRFHQEMQRAQRQFGERLSVFFLPVPQCPRCNGWLEESGPGQHRACEYGRLAWAVRTAEPSLFARFHDWLMELEEVPRLNEVHRYAATLVGPDVLERALASPALDEELQKIAGVYGAAGGGNLPKLIAGNAILNGAPNGDTLAHFLGRIVGLNQRASV